jgi:hypothetical protein
MLQLLLLHQARMPCSVGPAHPWLFLLLLRCLYWGCGQLQVMAHLASQTAAALEGQGLMYMWYLLAHDCWLLRRQPNLLKLGCSKSLVAAHPALLLLQRLPLV